MKAKMQVMGHHLESASWLNGLCRDSNSTFTHLKMKKTKTKTTQHIHLQSHTQSPAPTAEWEHLPARQQLSMALMHWHIMFPQKRTMAALNLHPLLSCTSEHLFVWENQLS